MNENSDIAANRFLKKENSNVKYYHSTLVEAYNKFHLKDKISFSSFVKYMPKIFKPPHRFTDMCEYCDYSTLLLNL